MSVSEQNLETRPEPSPQLGLRRGDRVRVRSAVEIAATLDSEGTTEGLPFMPEMAQLCGQEFVVDSRASMNCDTITPYGPPRTMPDTVHLAGLRCDGSAHGGCQAGCLLFFNERWLERDWTRAATAERGEVAKLETKLMEFATTEAESYSCQATQLVRASSPLDMKDHGHWLSDLTTRNVPLRKFARAVLYAFLNKYQRMSQRLPAPLRFAGGSSVPVVRGEQEKTPSHRLDLQPGDLVEVKSKEEIFATLDRKHRNRGLLFDREMLPYCGRRTRVLRRVNRIIDETSGRMIEMKRDCLILEGFACSGSLNKLCTRAIYGYWREIWLRRVEEPKR